jgi:hypothetical protein
VLATGECAANTGSCTDNDLRLYSNLPTDGLLDNHMLRSFLRVEVLSNLSVTKEWGSRVSFVGQTSYVAKAVEFIFSAGMPWAFTEKQLVGSLDMGTGTWSFADPDGEDCYSINNAYASFVNDPFYTSITLPPAPPTVKPPNIIKPSSWRRRSLTITQSEVDRWGRVAPVVTVSAGDAGLSTLRVRFYGNGVSSGCGFEGEYLISYVPPNSTMVLDAMRRDVTITRADGSKVPGGHLVYGSDGLPMKWPSLGCAATYVMVADLLPGQSGITVLLESSVRE